MPSGPFSYSSMFAIFLIKTFKERESRSLTSPCSSSTGSSRGSVLAPAPRGACRANAARPPRHHLHDTFSSDCPERPPQGPQPLSSSQPPTTLIAFLV